MSLKKELIKCLKKAGAYDVRVADPKSGFEYALPRKHPLEVWQDCRSVIVFVVAKAAITNNIYAGNLSPFSGERGLSPAPKTIIKTDQFAVTRLANLFKDSIFLKCIRFLQDKGHDWRIPYPNVQDKLCAYEAGIGVYGRSGIILHPELGNRINIGTIYTDAVLEPDSKCEGFNPCEYCMACVNACPAKAYGQDGTYHGKWNKSLCLEARSKVEGEGYFCHNCFAVCPAGKYRDEDLYHSKTVQGYDKIRR